MPSSPSPKTQRKKPSSRPSKKPKNKQQFWMIAAGAVLALLMIGVALFAWYAVPRNYKEFSKSDSPLKIFIEYPHFLSLGEENEIHVTLVNLQADTLGELTNISFSLFHPDSVALAISLHEGDSLTFKRLKQGERKTIRLTLRPYFRAFVKEASWAISSQPATFSFKTSYNAPQPSALAGDFQMHLSPLAKNWLLLKTFGLLAFSFFIWLLQDIWKRSFGGE